MSVLVYFQGDIEAAKAAAPDAKPLRFANAKHFRGEVEWAGYTKAPGRNLVPVAFDQVFLSPGVQVEDAIRETYKAVGIEVAKLEPVAASVDALTTAVSAKTPADLGWKLRSSPQDYLKRYPQGANAALAAEIIEKLEG